ncbi:ATP-binding cassette domain-containing protein [Streptomyces sp. NPDC020141]|uniref:ATP-binding cassette domain-containing protein n=1 Tax=Streptomyces sp. NPDC020141 TaxID=3365065 RepID=UPI0037A9D18F
MSDLYRAVTDLLARCLRQSRSKTWTAIGLMLAGAAAVPLSALAMRWLFNAVAGGHPGEAATAGAVVAVALLGALTLSHFAHVAYFELAEAGTLHYDEELIALANGSPGLHAHEDARHADHLTVLANEVQNTRMALQALLTLSGLAVGLAITAVLLAVVHPLLLLLPLAAVPSVLAGGRAERVLDGARAAAAEPTRHADNLYRIATEPGPMKELLLYGLADEVRRRRGELWARATALLWRAHLKATALRLLGQLGFVAGYAAAVFLVVLQANAGHRSAGDVVLIVVLAAQANAQVAQAVGLLPALYRLAAVDRRLVELRSAIRTTAAGPSGGSAEAAAPAALRHGITLTGVGFAYPGTERETLRAVDLTLPAGSTVAIVGENGAGKSSLVKLLCGFYQPTSGTVTVDGVDLRHIGSRSWRARIAAGFQDFVRYEFAAREAVGVGDLPRIDSAEAIAAAMERAGDGALIPGLPQGHDTRLGTSHTGGVQLSGGQWQKLALGRAFMREQPLLLVLDEPTASLDAAAEHALFERYTGRAAAAARAAGAVTVLVSHRFSTVRTADLIVVMAGGEIVEAGDHAALIASGGLYAELFTLQARAFR